MIRKVRQHAHNLIENWTKSQMSVIHEFYTVLRVLCSI